MELLIENIKKKPLLVIEKLKEDKFTELINYLNENYYENGITFMSDEMFDIINEYYLKKFGDIKLSSNNKKKIKLPYFLGSQEKIKSSEKEINNWIGKYSGPYCVSNKLDGLSVLVIKNDDIVKMYTKSTDGIHGRDRSHHLDFININVKNMKNGDAIRGELIISKDNFEKHLASIRNNPRNTATGFINNDKSNKKYLKFVDFVAFCVLNPIMQCEEQFEYIKKLKMKHSKYWIKNEIDIENLSEILIKNKKEYEYEIDGLVIVDSSQIYPLMEEKYPKYSFSFKSVLTEEKVETIVIDIEWNISKNGRLFPILIVDEVEINNVKINRCTANNAKYIVINNINVGTRLYIRRSNDVIPKIDSVIKPSEEPGLPKDIKFIWDKTNTHIISVDRNEEQENDLIIKQILSTIDKLNIEFLGKGNITKFVENGYNSFFKILKSENNKDDLYEIEGFSEKIIDKIFASINKSLKNVKLIDLMASSNFFDGLGKRKLKLIIDIYPNIIELYENKKNIYEDIINIHGYEKISTDNFIAGLPNFIKWLNKLLKIKPNINIINKEIKKQKKTNNNNEYDGKKIVFSGVRDKDLEKKLESLGAIISNSISKNTFLLIVKDINENSAKINKAKELGVRIVGLEEFEI